jgi:hypothetical protein
MTALPRQFLSSAPRPPSASRGYDFTNPATPSKLWHEAALMMCSYLLHIVSLACGDFKRSVSKVYSKKNSFP